MYILPRIPHCFLQEGLLMKNTYNFAYEYEKLNYPIFCTIRGVSHYPLKSSFFFITIKRKAHCFAVLKHQQSIMIKDIPIELLVWDVAPYKINTHYQFMEFLNRFRRFHKLTSTEDFVMIAFFEKLWKSRQYKLWT